MSPFPIQPPSLTEQLDAVGQRYRGQRLARGAMLSIGVASLATGAAVWMAHAGAGRASGGTAGWLVIVPVAWAAVLLAAAAGWIAVPLLLRPRALAMAALVESRLPGLHNGPTNAVRLGAERSLDGNGWRDAIVAEVEMQLAAQPLHQATPWSELRRPAIVAAAMLALLGAAAGLAPAAFAQGWQQMFHPAAFVPQSGAARLLGVHPGDTTLVAGQPLDITADVTLPPSQPPVAPPQATLIFDDSTPVAPLTPIPLPAAASADAPAFRYSEHLDHVDRTVRYRLDVGGTQSRWFTVSVVRQIRLMAMTLKISPPPYLNAKPTVQTLTGRQLGATTLAVPQGSAVQLSASIDVAAGGALLQLGQAPPVAMNSNTERTTFTAAPFTVAADTPVAVLLTDGSSQVIATVPADPWMLHAIPDAPPTVQMLWPTQDSTVSPSEPLIVRARLGDDHGLTSARVLVATDPAAPLAPLAGFTYAGKTAADLEATLNLPAIARRDSNVVRIQVEATDNRQLPGLGPQTMAGPVVQLTFADPAALPQQQADDDRLRAVLLQMLKTQEDLAAATAAELGAAPPATRPAAAGLQRIRAGQVELRTTITTTAKTYPFTPTQQATQKTLAVLALNPAKDAVDCCDALLGRPAGDPVSSAPAAGLAAAQRQIVDTLRSLLAMLGQSLAPAPAPPSPRGGQIASTPDAFKQLDQALRQFMTQQQRLLNQTAGLAKIPADDFSRENQQELAKLRQEQDDLDAFLQGKINDFSSLAEQDFSNASVTRDLESVLAEVTMAKNALQQQTVSAAVPAESSSLELAQEISSNIERWLTNAPDRIQWTQEDLPSTHDIPMAELPAQLQDMVGQLLEQEEDLLDNAQDANANITDSGDKGLGWDAGDGPIANMSAKGVTGNVLPNNNQMGGRSGEGRSAQSEGEFVGDSAVGKGGRRTPTRLDPTAFAQGQIKDTSRDPTGGATGGGKISGEGSAGLQGPAPAADPLAMHRLAKQQAEIRNVAERLNLQLGLSRYDNFKLTQSILLMRRVESDFDANRYGTALRTRDELLDDLATSRMLLAGAVHVQQDTTPTIPLKLQQQLDDAAKADLPPAWSEPLKEYYQKLAGQPQ